ncbi:MAG: carbohydrate-binding protein [Colwellia sp.]
MLTNKIKNNNISQLAVTLLLSVTVFTLSGCFGVDSNNGVIENPNKNVPIVDPEPEPVGLSKLHTDANKWVNADNETVILKGTNLGNWLLHEFWMMNQSANTEVVDQCTLEAKFDERFGFDERERLLDLFRDNWIKDRDWDIMEDFGLNVIRLPFVWNVIEDENNPKTLRSDAWQYIDYTIEQAEARGMYVILDLHGAVGAQGWNDHSGCADKNEYWSTPEYQERTIWLWQQIAERYKDNNTVAAYGILNEPWGTDPKNLAEVMITLQKEIRKTDAEKIILMPGYYSGIDDYGHPDDFGGTNIAFEMHFYPGIFDDLGASYETHRDWLACGESGTDGVCYWNTKMEGLASPLLIGEFQTWAQFDLEFGGELTRATYDKFAEYHWAATNWTYKLLTGSGGQSSWGMVTNKKLAGGLVTSANTWACIGWDSSFAESCNLGAEPLLVNGEGEQTYYLVAKFGTNSGGSLDISLDKLSITDENGNNGVINGDFGSADNWTTWTASAAPTIDFNATNSDILPTGAEGAVLRMTGSTNETTTEINGGIYQAVTLTGGKNYTVSGVFKDNASSNSWAEIYLISDEPIDGSDIEPKESLPSVDFANAPIEDIEAIFQLYGTVEYEVHQPLLTAMTAAEPSKLYTLPAPPTDLVIVVNETSVKLTWAANQEEDVIGYNIYRSVNNNSSYELLAEKVSEINYIDETIDDANIYYYKISAIDNEDISYSSNEVVSGMLTIELPGVIQAENWSDMSGFEAEETSDIGGGGNIGFADPDDWLEYSVNIATASEYLIEYRLATENGSEGFTVSIDDTVIDTVVVAATGGWQTWLTQSNTVTLPAGEHTFRLDAIGNEWNLNWISLSLAP